MNSLPPITLYAKYLNTASILFNLTIDECRSRFGLYTEKQWIELLNN